MEYPTIHRYVLCIHASVQLNFLTKKMLVTSGIIYFIQWENAFQLFHTIAITILQFDTKVAQISE